MIGNRFQVSNRSFYRYKVVKEGLIFGIKPDQAQNASVWAYFDSGLQFSADLIEKESLEQVPISENPEEVPEQNLSTSELKA